MPDIGGEITYSGDIVQFGQMRRIGLKETSHPGSLSVGSVYTLRMIVMRSRLCGILDWGWPWVSGDCGERRRRFRASVVFTN